MEVDTYAHHRRGVEHAVDADFRVVAHNEAAEQEVCTHEGVRGVVPDADFRVVVLEVGGVRAGADVAPLPYHGVAEEPVVRLVGIPEHDDVVELAAGLTDGAEGGASVYLGAHVDVGMVAEGYRTTKTGAFHDLCVAADVDRTAGDVDCRAVTLRVLLYEDGLTAVLVKIRADDCVSVVKWLRDAAGCKAKEVAADEFAVEQEDIEDEPDGVEWCAVDLRIPAYVIETGHPAACGDEHPVGVYEGVAGVEVADSGNEGVVGEYVSGNKERFGVIGRGAEFRTEIIDGVMVCGSSEGGVPFLCDGGDADAEISNGACEREREEIILTDLCIAEVKIAHRDGII